MIITRLSAVLGAIAICARDVDRVPVLALAVTATVVIVITAMPVAAAVVVLALHGIKGTDPGPAGHLLIVLVGVLCRGGTSVTMEAGPDHERSTWPASEKTS